MPEAVEPKYIRIDHTDKPAGGRGAVKSTFKSYTAQGMSPLKAASMLLQANKLAKFDCPGCAFPDNRANLRSTAASKATKPSLGK
ncbi:MAG: hypothetical protein R3E61_10260 [Pseudomonadales bacterium]